MMNRYPGLAPGFLHQAFAVGFMLGGGLSGSLPGSSRKLGILPALPSRLPLTAAVTPRDRGEARFKAIRLTLYRIEENGEQGQAAVHADFKRLGDGLDA